MYKVTTYRSRPLKRQNVTINAAADAAAFVEEKKPAKEKKGKKGKKNKRKDKNIPEEKVYIIANEEVRESDLTDDERADIYAEQAINKDGFYTALDPIDINYVEYGKGSVLDKRKFIAVVGVIVGAIVLLAGVLAISFI